MIRTYNPALNSHQGAYDDRLSNVDNSGNNHDSDLCYYGIDPH